eukprot:GHVP01005033.1.p1 GENE.GHVP01005033.1~~GHVP01005033.1.p1  ORF type:complete len:793 (+),score=95.43 GHVP01005033.1:601-2979(+)
MRVRHLQTFLAKNDICKNCSISELKDLTLGIDAVHWLRSLDIMRSKFIDPLGGFDLEELQRVCELKIEQYKKFGISVIFVFPGLLPRHKALNFGLYNLPDSAWRKNPPGKSVDDVEDLNGETRGPTTRVTDSIPPYVSLFLFNFLVKKNIECLHSPGLPGAQLSYLAETGKIDCVLAQPSAILFCIKNLILSVDLDNSSFVWISQEEIFTTLDVNRTQFLVATLLAGTEYCFTHPIVSYGQYAFLPSVPQMEFNFIQALCCAKQSPLSSFVQQFPTERMKKDHEEAYASTYTIMNRCPVLTDNNEVIIGDFRDGTAHFDPSTTVPEDYDKILGRRVYQPLLALMINGTISSVVPSVLSQEIWTDLMKPSYETYERRDLEIDTRSIKRRALGLLSSELPLPFRPQKVTFYRRSESNQVQEEHHETLPLIPPNIRWVFTRESVYEELHRQKRNEPSLSFALRWHAHVVQNHKEGNLFLLDRGTTIQSLSTQILRKKTDQSNYQHQSTTSNPSDQVSVQKYIQTLVVFKTLDILQYFAPGGQHTIFGHALAHVRGEFRPQMLVVLELMRQGLITGDDLYIRSELSKRPITRNSLDKDSRHSLLLISRVFSLVGCICKEPWNAEIDYDLACYHDIVRALRMRLDSVVEVALAHSILNLARTQPDIKIKEADYPKINLVPADRNILGVIVKYFLELDQSYLSKGIDEIRLHLKKTFLAVEDPIPQLLKGLGFWFELRNLVKSLGRQNPTDEKIKILDNSLERGTNFLTPAFTNLKEDSSYSKWMRTSPATPTTPTLP